MSSSTFRQGLVFDVTQNTQLPTIHDILTVPNPKLLVTPARPQHMRPDRTANKVDQDGLSRWDEFNLQVLSDAFGDILNRHVHPSNHAQPGPFTINGLGDLRAMCIRSIFPLLTQPIAIGAAEIGSRINYIFPPIYAEQNQSLRISRISALSFMADFNGSPRTQLVVSCVLHGTQWNSTALSGSLHSAALLPIRRIATYCILANTRYGFILTAQELVVVRVSGTAYEVQKPGQVEWQAIPWDASGPNVLTVTLSLWFLVMLSLRDTCRSICAPDQVPPLHRWWKYQKPQVTIFHHHISMRESFDHPAGASVEEKLFRDKSSSWLLA
ncbi:hypothetical protein FSARC_10424 [Fusarium sarcochroum]|uniref:Uncharacterized protein n=1 Tax=Fusarium sarcochroum TaxID=1208366 RepID=A0A8H4TM99_9HYPO|nr:hypothetical protein FSARC_10424 [Fusarium sarcochroum]